MENAVQTYPGAASRRVRGVPSAPMDEQGEEFNVYALSTEVLNKPLSTFRVKRAA
jgi:hypothetical protein